MHFKVEHRFNIEPNKLWNILSSDDFREQLNQKNRIKSKIISQTDEAGIRKVQSEIVYVDPLPKIEAKLLGTSHLSYTLEQRISDKKWLSQWRILIPKLGNKIKAQGQFQLIAEGSRSQRNILGEIAVSVPLIGRKIEKNIVSKLQSSYDNSAEFIASWIQKS